MPRPQVNFRAKPEEIEAWDKARGAMSLSAWMRQLANKAARKSVEKVGNTRELSD